jgi:CRP/FNR family transcriptional regulator, anaerobic regulatory protein
MLTVASSNAAIRAFAPAALPSRATPRSAPETAGTVLAFARHATIFHAGDPATRLFEVLEGAVMLTQLLDDGRRQVVEIVLRGGLAGFAPADVYPSTCEALCGTRLRAWRKREVRLDAALQEDLMRRAERQICDLHGYALALGRMTARERVATLLLRFAAAGIVHAHDRSVSLEVPLTRGEMGDHLGLSLETVCRTLTALQRQGVIGIGKRHGEIVLRDTRRLRGLAGQ